MKYIFSMILLFGFAGLIFARTTPWLKVEVNSREEIVPLIENGFEMLDARVRPVNFGEKEEYQISWFPENGFVTIKGNAAVAAEIERLGYRVLKSGIAADPQAVQPEGRSLPDQLGWPKTMAGWPGVYGQATTIADVNNSGKREVFLNNIEGYIYMWKYNGTFVLGYPQIPYLIPLVDPSTGDTTWVSWASTGSDETAAAGDVNGDGLKEFVFGKDIGKLFAYQPSHNPFITPGFPQDLGLAFFSNDPALYDLDNDGKDEIVLVSYLWPSGSSTYGPGLVHIFNEDGTEMPGWPQQIAVNSESSPAIGDIDGDFEPEIVVGSGRDLNNNIKGQLIAWNLDGTVCSGFPIEAGYAVNSTPSLADIDLNGFVDILIRMKLESTERNGVYAYNGQGQLLSGFPAVMPRGGTTGAPAVADMDGDGLPEIAIGAALAVDSGMVYVFNYDGSPKTGFPRLVNRTWVERSVALADVSGDGLPDVVATTNGTTTKPGMVWAFDYQGNVVQGFPITTPSVIGSSLESAPSVVDVDGDGDTELFTANWDNTVFAWDTPGLEVPENSWPMYKYNAARTGNQFHKPVGIEGQAHPVPEEFTLYQNYPNPFNPETQISFYLPFSAEISLSVYNLLGQEVSRLINGKKYSAGEHQITFRAENLPTGIYFYELKTPAGGKTSKMILMK